MLLTEHCAIGGFTYDPAHQHETINVAEVAEDVLDAFEAYESVEAYSAQTLLFYAYKFLQVYTNKPVGTDRAIQLAIALGARVARRNNP